MSDTIEYLDFELQFREDDGDYSIEVLHSPAGESGQCDWVCPFPVGSLSDLREKLQFAVLSASARTRGPSSLQEKTLREFGTNMYDSIFSKVPKIAGLYRASLAMTDPETQGLRIKLRVEAPELACLPWEFLYSKDDNSYLTLQRRTPLIRYIQLPNPPRPIGVEGPLNVLGMICNPGGDWEPLDVARERTYIEDAIDPLQRAGRVHFEWVPGETGNHLLDKLQERRWHVFHFIGHGGVDKNGNGFIVLRDESGGPLEITQDMLPVLLEGSSALRLAVLNCCEGARSGVDDPFASPAASLVRSGIPAVVAMQFPITDSAAIHLSSGIYTSLANNQPIDAAVAAARKRMMLGSKLEWGIPVLYMRSPDGHLFDVGATPPAPQPTPAPAAEPSRSDEPAFNDDSAVPHTTGLDTGGFSTGTGFLFDSFADPVDIQSDLVEFDSYQELRNADLATLAHVIQVGKRLIKGASALSGSDQERIPRTQAYAYYRRGRIYAKTNEMPKARTDFTNAIELDDAVWKYRYHRASVSARMGLFDNALKDADVLIHTRPDEAEFHWIRGVVCVSKARGPARRDWVTQAIASYSQATELKPDEAKYFRSRAGAYKLTGEHQRQLNDLNRVLELKPGTGKDLYHRATLRAELGDRKGAMQDLEAAAAVVYAPATRDLAGGPA